MLAAECFESDFLKEKFQPFTGVRIGFCIRKLSDQIRAAFFAKQSHGLLKGYIAAVIARGFFHALGGYLYWMSYMPDNFPKSLTAIYPIVYNYSYLLAEGIITVIVISIPAVSKALTQVKKAALGTSL